MAAICDMALGKLADCRYFLGIVHDWIKTGFMRKKEASSYIQMVFIIGSNKGKIISVSHVTDTVTCSQQKLKNFLFSSAW